MQTSALASRICLCFPGDTCRCEPDAPFAWNGRTIRTELLVDAHNDFGACVAWGLVDRSEHGWRAFLDGYTDMAVFYGRRSLRRARERAA